MKPARVAPPSTEARSEAPASRSSSLICKGPAPEQRQLPLSTKSTQGGASARVPPPAAAP
jgi:hypothetical protein